MSIQRIIALAILALSFATCSEGIELKRKVSEAQGTIEQAVKEEKFLFLYFYKPGQPLSEEMAKIMEEAGKKYKDRANFVSVNIEDKNEEKILSRFGAQRAPLTVVLAPNEAVTGNFPGKIDLNILERGLVSDKTTRTIKAFQDGKAVILLVGNEKTPSFKEIEKEIVSYAQLLGNKSELILLDPEEKKEASLLSMVGLNAPLEKATTLVLSPFGILDKFEGRVSLGNLSSAYQKYIGLTQQGAGGGGCSSGGSKKGVSCCAK